jgi:hypothetical protein
VGHNRRRRTLFKKKATQPKKITELKDGDDLPPGWRNVLKYAHDGKIVPNFKELLKTKEDFLYSLTVQGCVNFLTAKETLWLVEAAQMLCAGVVGEPHAVELVELTLKSLKAQGVIKRHHYGDYSIMFPSGPTPRAALLTRESSTWQMQTRSAGPG